MNVVHYEGVTFVHLESEDDDVSAEEVERLCAEHGACDLLHGVLHVQSDDGPIEDLTPSQLRQLKFLAKAS